MSFSQSREAPLYPDQGEDHARGRQRRRVFLFTAIPVLLAGLLYTALQRPIYESKATALMSAPTAIDEKMLDADVQGVAIQRRTLTGSEITAALSRQLEEEFGVGLSSLDLRELLRVEAVPETNLLELAARGEDKRLLPVLVESWLEVYMGIRARDIEARRDRTLTEVQDELGGLEVRLVEARSALDAYREEHDIISMDRKENEVLSRLDGLNKALNRAVEEEVRARAYLETLRDSLAEGEQVVPSEERGRVSAMAGQLNRLRNRLTELRSRYTDDYIRKDPRLREIPEQIQELEGKLAEAYAEGSEAELDNAERAYGAARESVRDLEERLEAHKEAVSRFNTMYATHQALVQDLARLEALNREAQARLVQIEVRDVEKYPQISVIDWPGGLAARVGPPYTLLLGGTLLAALTAGIFSVWLYAYLNPRQARPAYVTLSGVHLYPQDTAGALEQGAAAARLTDEPARRLEQGARSEATNDEGAEDQEEDDATDPRKSE